jgi:hypothetical protein
LDRIPWFSRCADERCTGVAGDVHVTEEEKVSEIKRKDSNPRSSGRKSGNTS